MYKRLLFHNGSPAQPISHTFSQSRRIDFSVFVTRKKDYFHAVSQFFSDQREINQAPSKTSVLFRDEGIPKTRSQVYDEKVVRGGGGRTPLPMKRELRRRGLPE